MTKFSDFLNITLELLKYSLKSFVSSEKLVKTTTICDLCFFLHKIFCKMVRKFCEIFLWELPSRRAKFFEILSHSVRYGMYVSNPSSKVPQ